MTRRALLLFVLSVCAPASLAATLRVSPAEFVIQDVPVGTVCDLQQLHGVALTIHNEDDQAHTYRLSARAPAAGTWQEGYTPLPDPNWFSFETDTVTVEAGGIARSRMLIRIPKDPAHYNQHWVVSLAVEALPEPGSIVALAAYPRVYIETQARVDLRRPPSGKTGVAPSVVCLGAPRKGVARGEFRVFNGDSEPHSYRLRLAAGARKILPSPGYGWIGNLAWLSLSPASITIPAGHSRRVTVMARIPDSYQVAMPAWEAIVFVEPGEPAVTASNFVRVRAKPAGRRAP